LAFLKVSKELGDYIVTKCNNVRNFPQAEIDNIFKTDKILQNVFVTANKLLEKNLFVIIKNIGFNNEKNLFESFVKLFGEFYGAVEYTDIKMDCPYTGCKYDLIDFHNDDAIDLKRQPKNGFIQVLTEDPLKLTMNGVVKIDNIVNYLEMYDREFLKQLFCTKIPMLSYGINYDDNDDTEIIMNHPILYKENNENKVRFDLTRTRHFYWKKGIEQSLEEKILIDKFLNLAKKFREEFYLEQGDIFIHNNKRTLHDRTACSFEMNIDGSFSTRSIFVSFTRE
jgi:hypothetical protein